MTKEQLIYDLAKEIFLRKLPIEYLNDKNEDYHFLQIDNSIRVAKLFYKRVEKDEEDGKDKQQ
jgi:hypothetical protein